ncbi:choice-of-anchor D domain-containing protein [Simiduia agarivorans]|uniref:Abnormal spindle-like microcephaly-associated protein ASH domain-containing protein n=1 Tax=Simiduia agarivorans (strain DSM 21679 / JCM 13881 / BCRC 17597 / SA1) TaxID=1117647 RepID=K4KH01_SIMAS|nr:choice-of-anchor D domain-containing protein [Simiduia agarivorans]AFU98384.1 hypothetical protein M5M_05935 [Simiduia agarivorans SA1 = DSM 21679]
MRQVNTLTVACVMALLACNGQSETLFYEGFESGDATGWQLLGNVAVSGTQSIGNYSLRLKKTATAVHALDTTGYSDVTVAMRLAATGLEDPDRCYAEVSADAGQQWQTLITLADGQDNATFFSGSLTDAAFEDNPDLQVRFRSTGDLLGDYCWGDEVSVTGTAGGLQPAPDITQTGQGGFGNVNLGETASRSIVLENAGNALLVFNAASITGSAFALQQDGCSNQTLSPSANCTLTVTFTPAQVGFVAGDIQWVNNSDQSPWIIDLTGSGIEQGSVVDNYDPLSGSGAVSRSQLTYADLHATGDGSRVAMDAFTLPANAAHPQHQFNGRLALSNEASSGAFDEIKDTFRYTGSGDSTRKHLPEFDMELVQTGSHLVPVLRGTQANVHPEWEYIVQPGRVWQENGDNGASRAALPFALHQKNANCMHNGVMSFTFDGAGSVSNVAYQISSETCLYFKFDMWGRLPATYSAYEPTNAASVRAAHQADEAARMPVKPIAQLAVDYPGIDVSQFGSASETDPEHMTLFGLVYKGVNYVGGCDTRAGQYPFCDVLTVPSYSTAKSVFAGAALMRLEQRFPGARNEKIADWVPDCAANGNWGDVTFEHALDMATGNYRSSIYMSDEGASHTNDLFLPEDHASKISYSCNYYDRKATPGSQWVYHTSDTYTLGTAMNAYLRAQDGSNSDIFADAIVRDIWSPLGLSPVAKVTRRTYDSIAQPFAGWGLTYQRDDVAKLADFFNRANGQVNGVQALSANLLQAALQRNDTDRGPVPLTDYHYNNGFWAHEIGSDVGCSAPLWVPFMSGYGGISVLLLPNGASYYYFSDNDTYLWKTAAKEAHKLAPLCQ